MTDEELIAAGALKRAKEIVDNKDFWSGPGPAKTSGEAVGLLLEVAKTAGRSKPTGIVEVIPPQRSAKAAKNPEPPKTDGEPAAATEPADVQ